MVCKSALVSHYRKRTVALGKRGYKGKLARKVNKLSKIVRRNAPEVKWVVKSSQISPTYSFAGYNSLLDGLSQGITDYGNRIGDAIDLKRGELFMRIDPPGTFNFAVVYRVLVFFWKANPDHAISNASMPALYLHDSGIVSTTYAPFAPFDHDNKGNFQTIFDKTYVLNPHSGNATTPQAAVPESILIRKKFNFKGKQVHWNAGTTADITKNELFYLVISNNANTSTVTTTFMAEYTDA